MIDNQTPRAKMGDVGAVYLGALVLGLGTILSQVVVGHLGHGAGGDGDAGGELDGDADAIEAHHPSADFVALIFSVRFWTFALMAFGLTGTLLHYAFGVRGLLTVLAAIALGFGTGSFAAWVFRAAASSTANSASEANDLVGQLGRVMLPCSPGQSGKVRIELKGQLVEYVASTDEPLSAGDIVLVEEVRGSTVHVSGAPDTLRGVT